MFLNLEEFEEVDDAPNTTGCKDKDMKYEWVKVVDGDWVSQGK